MRRSGRNRNSHGARLLLAALASIGLTGCATIMSGDPQTVRVTTRPPGRVVYYQGHRVADGELLTVKKQFRTPQFNVGAAESPVLVDAGYSVQPWVLGDAGLALLFLIPGIVAGGVDAGTGAWRKLDDPQVLVLDEAVAAAPPAPSPAEPPATPATTPAPAPKPRTRTAAPAATPAPAAPLSVEEGIVSWYEPSEPEGRTASGERFDSGRLTAAHRTLPFGSLVRVTRLDTEQSVEVVINDRGPRVEGRVLDVSRRAAEQLGLLDVGLAPCRVEVLRRPAG